MEALTRSCIDCAVGKCDKKQGKEGTGGYPPFCLTTHMDSALREEAVAAYEEDENGRIMRVSAQVEYENYCKMTRVEETAEFCKKMEYHKIGIATCVGLLREASVFARILRAKGFEVFGICCKAGTVPKTAVGISKECEEIGCNMCNPVLQAKMLNRVRTDINVVIGLCVGHDSLFYKYSAAPVTTLFTKDRVLAHNAAGALYQTGSYYARLLGDEN